MRYIHQNPVKARIVNKITQYPWSSYNEYFRIDGICNTKFALNLFAEGEQNSASLFRNFNSYENDDKCLEYEERVRIDDIEAMKIIKRITGQENPNQIKNFEKEERDKIIKRLKNSKLSIRQIERLTGISFGVIRRI